MNSGMVYNIQRMSTKDGPGLRTTVFLKGCPLHCLWCSNPESQSSHPQLMCFENLCTSCGACEKICPHRAVIKTEKGFNRERSKCKDCGLCVDVCPSKARVMSGQLMTVKEVMDIVTVTIFFMPTLKAVSPSAVVSLPLLEIFLLNSCRIAPIKVTMSV